MEMEHPTHRPGHQALRRGRVSQPGQVYFITTTTVRRTPFFADYLLGHTAIACLFDRAVLGDSRILAFVLMPDHLHFILTLGHIHELSDTVSRLKANMARQVNRCLARQGAVWSRGYYEHALRHEDDIVGIARYIVANPLRAGLVKHLADYPLWDAIWL